MKFTIYNQDQIAQAIHHISQLPIDKKYVVEIKKAHRTLAQNSLYWLWLTEISAQDNYFGKALTKDGWHYICGLRYLGVEKIEANGITLRMPKKSTKDLPVSEFAEYLTKIEADFLQRGVCLTFPDYYGSAMLKD